MPLAWMAQFGLVAMAIRTGAPLLVDEEALDKTGTVLEPLSESVQAPPEGMQDDQYATR